MSRLTKKSDYGMYFYPECFNDECSGIGTNEKCEVCRFNHEICEKLGEYEDLEEQGRLVKLPCKDVYFIVDINDPKYAMVMKKPIMELAIYEIEDIDNVGCKYFSTEAKAKAKLKELGGGENE